jgi:hypothetical protein
VKIVVVPRILQDRQYVIHFCPDPTSAKDINTGMSTRCENRRLLSMAEQMSKDEQIGFHKGAISTLMKEREEMAKILSIVEQLLQMHIKALKSLGVDLVAQAQQGKKATDKLDELIKK